MAKNINYDFNLVSGTDYSIVLVTKVSNRVIKLAFDRSREAYKNKKGVDVGGSFEEVKEFDAEDRWLKLIHTGVKAAVNDVGKQVKKDGIIVLNSYVEKCTYRLNDGGGWDVFIIIKGSYADRRQIK